MKRTTLILLGVLVLAAIGGAFLFGQKQDVSKMSSTNLNQDAQTPGTSQENVKENNQNPIPQPSSEYSVRPDFSKVQNFKKTFVLQKNVSVRHDNSWIEKKGSGEFVTAKLLKTINGRSYAIGFEEKDMEYFSPDLQSTDVESDSYAEIQINGKPHFISVSSSISSDGRHDFSHIVSICPGTHKACSLPMGKDYLLITLQQNVPGAQEVVSLDFSRKDDQQILAEFTEIASTLQY